MSKPFGGTFHLRKYLLTNILFTMNAHMILKYLIRELFAGS